MAIVYSYPIATPESQDLLVGTEMALQGGEDSPRTRTFTIGSIVDLIKPYKVYTALLSQTGEDAPVPTVLENTLVGTVDWTREEAGNYIGTLNGAFPEGKTVCFYTHDGFNGSTGYGGLVRNDSNSVWMTFNNGTGAYIDTQGQSDSIEIRVYN